MATTTRVPDLSECFCLKDVLSAEDCRKVEFRDQEDVDENGSPGEHLRLIGKLVGNRDVMVRLSGFRPWLYLDLEDRRKEPRWVETVFPALVESLRSSILKRGLARTSLDAEDESDSKIAVRRRYDRESEHCRRRMCFLERSRAGDADSEDAEGFDDPQDDEGLIRFRLVLRSQVHGWEPEDKWWETSPDKPITKRRLYARLSFRSRAQQQEAERLLSRPQTVREPWAKGWNDGLLAQNVKVPVYEGRIVPHETAFLTWMTSRGGGAKSESDVSKPWSWFHLSRKRDVPEGRRESWCDEEWEGDVADLVYVSAHEGVLPELRVVVGDTEWMSNDLKTFPQPRNWGDYVSTIGMVWADVRSGQAWKINYEADCFADPTDPRYAIEGDDVANIPPNKRALNLPEYREAQSALEVAEAKAKRFLSLAKAEFGKDSLQVQEAREKLDSCRIAARVRRHSTELECGRSWFLRIRELRPDVIWFFNGDKFDWYWLVRRLVMLEALPEEAIDWLRFSRLRYHVCHLGESEFNTKGKGYNAYYRVRVPACLNYDMLLWAKENYPKLHNHNLDNVLKEMKLRLKNDLTPKKIFKYTIAGHAKWRKMVTYCHKDCKRTGQMVQKGNFLPRWLALSSITTSFWNLLSSGGQQIRVWNLLLKTASKHKYVVNQIPKVRPSGVFKWVDDDRLKCKLVVARKPKESIRTWFRGVRIEWSGNWPGRKEISTKFRVANEQDKRLVSVELESRNYYQLYSGATVISPVPGLYVTPTVTLDFASLYPSIMIAFLLCFSTILNDVQLADDPRLGRFVRKHEVQPGNPHCFVDFPGMVSLLPELLRDLLAARRAVRKELEVTVDPARQKNLDAQQNEYKVTCNSVYGFTGAQLSGKYPEPRIAETVTYCGRMGLELTKQIVEAMDLQFYLAPDRWKQFVSQQSWLSAVTWYPRAKPAPLDPDEFKRKFKRPLSDGERSTLSKIHAALDEVPSDLWCLPASPGSPHQNAGYEYLCSRPDLFWLIERYGPLCEDPRTLLRPECSTKVIYGDSVAADTPVFWTLRGDPCARLSSVDSIDSEIYLLRGGTSSFEIEWKPYRDGEKEALEMPEDFMVWSDSGWTECRRLIRHRCDKELFRVTTPTASIVVTRDHSLLSPQGQKLHLDALKVGTPLLHAELPLPNPFAPESLEGEDLNYARQLGNYFASPPLLLHEAQNSDPRLRAWFFDSRGRQRVPAWVLQSSRRFRTAFLSGFNVASVSSSSYSSSSSAATSQGLESSPLAWAGLFALHESVGIEPQLGNSGGVRDAVSRIESAGFTRDYVYDLETATHHFAAGIGRMVVHNTDSVMVSFPLVNNLNSRRASFMLGNDAATLVTQTMNDARSLTNEKTYMPYKLLKKKRYFGHKWLFPDDLAPARDIKGIDVVRRDCIPIFKEQIMAWIHAILDTSDYDKAYAIFQEFRRAILERRFDIQSLVQTKSTKPHYANENQIQAVVCRQMEDDVPGSAPPPGGRVAYLVGDTGRHDDPMYKRVISWPRAKYYLDAKKVPPGFLSVVDISYYLDHNLKSIFVSIFDQWIKGGKPAAEQHFARFREQARLTALGQPTLRDFCGLPSNQSTNNVPPIDNSSKVDSPSPNLQPIPGNPFACKFGNSTATPSSLRNPTSKKNSTLQFAVASSVQNSRKTQASPQDDPNVFKRRRKNNPPPPSDRSTFNALFGKK